MGLHCELACHTRSWTCSCLYAPVKLVECAQLRRSLGQIASELPQSSQCPWASVPSPSRTGRVRFRHVECRHMLSCAPPLPSPGRLGLGIGGGSSPRALAVHYEHRASCAFDAQYDWGILHRHDGELMSSFCVMVGSAGSSAP